MQHQLSQAERAARIAGEVLREHLGKVHVRHKKDRFDLVTEADIAAQTIIEKTLSEVFPDYLFLGEEATHLTDTPLSSSHYCWVVDPLDGTTNFVHGVPFFCTSIALAKGDDVLCGVVYNPMTEEIYTAIQGEGAFLNGKRMSTSSYETLGESLVSVSLPTVTDRDSPSLLALLEAIPHCQAIRRTGSTALNLAFVAAGRFDVNWAFSSHAWDIAAGILLVKEAGGFVCKPDGTPIELSEPAPVCAVANEALAKEVLPLLKIFT